MRYFSNNNTGTALIIVLFVIAALTTLAVAFSQETGIEMNLTGYSRDSRMAHQIASSGVNLALALLVQDISDDKEEKVDSLDEPWAQINEDTIPWELEEDSSLKGNIIDENSRLNINILFESGETNDEKADQLKRLFTSLGLQEAQADPILDWLDKDDEERFDGAENLYYESLDPPYQCANGPFLTVSQIRLVKGVNDIIKNLEKEEKNLFDYITIIGDGKININTAPAEVLQSLHQDIDEEKSQAIISYRKENPFIKIEELKQVIGIDEGLYNDIDGLITVQSDRFYIKMESVYRTSSCTITAIAQRDEEKKEVEVVYWRVQ